MPESIEACVSKLPMSVLTAQWKSSRLKSNQSVSLAGKDRQAILDEGSLTRKLIKSSNNKLSIEVVRTRFVKPTREEVSHIGLDARRISYVREVLLKCDNHPCVYARIVIPASDLVGRLRRVKYLKNRSIGKLLFSFRDLELSQFQICRLLIDDFDIVGRRRMMTIGGKKILVSEFFLPASFQYIRA